MYFNLLKTLFLTSTCVKMIFFVLFCPPPTYGVFSIGHLHDDIILLLRPESFRGLLSCAN